MILTDTGPLVAILNRNDGHHQACVAALRSLTPPMVTTWPVLTEAFYLLEDAGRDAQEALIELVTRGRIVVHHVTDPARLLELLHKYADRPMDLADGSLVALAEQLRLYQVFTLDSTDFNIYRAHGRRTFTLVPARPRR
ncbi:MAG: type II toxin-antitoxin system VapC family toxin [Chloroflexota bacterium]